MAKVLEAFEVADAVWGSEQVVGEEAAHAEDEGDDGGFDGVHVETVVNGSVGSGGAFEDADDDEDDKGDGEGKSHSAAAEHLAAFV